MSDNSPDGSELSNRVLSLLIGALDALAARVGSGNEGDPSKPLFFRRGVGEISVSLTVAGETASLVISSDSTPPGQFGIVHNPASPGPPPPRLPPPPPPPAGSAHPMYVYADWNAASSENYTVTVHRSGGAVGSPKAFTGPGGQWFDFDK